ncbi:hypothetical protein P5V15_011705 [Pogonomyrmex californicus]
METLHLDISELAIVIQLLSYLIPPKQKVKQKSQTEKHYNKHYTKKHYNKASIALSRNSMIKYVTTCVDIIKIRQEVSDIANEIQTSIQLYIIIVGSIKNVTNSYVTINEILYLTESTLETLNVCFKAFHVLKINYLDTSKHLWMLIQKGLYQFHTLWDIIFKYRTYTKKVYNQYSLKWLST